MRWLVTGLALLWLCTAAQAQEFNPYQAMLDRMPLAEAEPLIVERYGPVKRRQKGIDQDYDGGPILLLSTGEDRDFTLFLFCKDKLAAFAAPISPAMAASILGPMTLEPGELSVFPADDGLSVQSRDGELAVIYLGVGTKHSAVNAVYSRTAMTRLDFAGRCAEVAD